VTVFEREHDQKFFMGVFKLVFEKGRKGQEKLDACGFCFLFLLYLE